MKYNLGKQDRKDGVIKEIYIKAKDWRKNF